MNKINKETLDLIKSFEGLETSAYLDAVGVWTIGYGHTAMAGSPIPVKGMKITAQEAEDLLLKDLKKYEAPVKNYVKVSLNDNQYGALVSFCYNLGGGNFKQSTLLKKVNLRDFTGASLEFQKWNKAGGKILKGLTRRREAERVLFVKPASGATQKPVEAIKDVPGISASEIKEIAVAPSTSLLGLLLGLLKLIFGRK